MASIQFGLYTLRKIQAPTLPSTRRQRCRRMNLSSDLQIEKGPQTNNRGGPGTDLKLFLGFVQNLRCDCEGPRSNDRPDLIALICAI
jgi:hypothetical protein